MLINAICAAADPGSRTPAGGRSGHGVDQGRDLCRNGEFGGVSGVMLVLCVTAKRHGWLSGCCGLDLAWPPLRSWTSALHVPSHALMTLSRAFDRWVGRVVTALFHHLCCDTPPDVTTAPQQTLLCAGPCIIPTCADFDCFLPCFSSLESASAG